jgi:hypothetical protein
VTRGFASVIFAAVLILVLLASSSCCCSYFETLNKKPKDYDAIKSELSGALDYQITEEEEEKFRSLLEEIYTGEELDKAVSAMNDLKSLYPKGYYIVVKVAPEFVNSGAGGEEFRVLAGDFSVDYLNILVHELTHLGILVFGADAIGDVYDYVYLIGRYGVLIDRDRSFFPKTEVFADISNPDDFDKLYLEPVEKNEGADLMNILDEINAYTKSQECEIALEELGGTWDYGSRHNLLKQKWHLELYLKRAYEKHPQDWEHIINNEGLSFFIMKLWQDVSRVEMLDREGEKSLGFNFEQMADVVYGTDNYSVMEKLFQDSGVAECEEMSYDDVSFKNLTVLPVP